MSYNPKITPLTITVGPAASYHEPPEPPGTTQVSQIPQIPQVQQPASYCQQPLTVVGRRRNHCNKSCLVAILLIIASVIILLTLLAAWFWGAFDHHEDKKYGHHATKMPADYKHKCPKHYLMYNGKCDESIYKDWRCDYDHSDCEKAEWYVGEICNKVAYKQCCIDNQEEFNFCDGCYAQPGKYWEYSIEYLEGMKAKAESSWCQDEAVPTTTTWCYWWQDCSTSKTWTTWTTGTTTSTTTSSTTTTTSTITTTTSTTTTTTTTTTITTTTTTTTSRSTTAKTTSTDSVDPTTGSSCPDYCSKQLDPMCGSDMVTYENLCTLQLKQCQEKDDLTLAYEGPCVSTSTTINPTISTTKCTEICPEIYLPVCGTNNETYSSECELHKVKCNGQNDLEIAHDGPCNSDSRSTTTSTTSSTPYKYEAWIGDGECDDITNVAEWNFDGHDCCQEPLVKGSCLDCQCKETSSSSSFETTTAYTAYEYTETTTTSTTEPPTTTCSYMCPMLWDPVCGSDMVTYGNDCQFDNAKCNENSNLEIIHRGPCDTTSTPNFHVDPIETTSTPNFHVDPIETTPGYMPGYTSWNWWSTSTSLPTTGSTHDDFTGGSSTTPSWGWWIWPSSYGSTESTSGSTNDYSSTSSGTTFGWNWWSTSTSLPPTGSIHDDFSSTGTTEGSSTTLSVM